MKPNFTLDTRLDSIGLPYIDVVLTERFLLPPAALKKIGVEVPKTLGEIENLNGMSLDQISAVLMECLKLNESIFVDYSELDTASLVDGSCVLDMRPDVNIDSIPLHQSARIFHLEDPGRLLPYLRSLDRVLVLSHTDSHAWSAAVSFRKMSIKAQAVIQQKV